MTFAGCAHINPFDRLLIAKPCPEAKIRQCNIVHKSTGEALSAPAETRRRSLDHRSARMPISPRVSSRAYSISSTTRAAPRLSRGRSA